MQSSATPPAAARPSRLARIFYAIPLIGWIARDVGRDAENLFYALPILVLALVLAVNVWGLAALTLAATALVPVIFVLLIGVTLP